ncbi:MAG: hypothetical protein IH991_14070 [Planctomycetes bacterium]|nr:hypothetical protein [Planctomycetota bacterium]
MNTPDHSDSLPNPSIRYQRRLSTEIIDAWQSQPESVKADILAMVKAAE